MKKEATLLAIMLVVGVLLELGIERSDSMPRTEGETVDWAVFHIKYSLAKPDLGPEEARDAVMAIIAARDFGYTSESLAMFSGVSAEHLEEMLGRAKGLAKHAKPKRKGFLLSLFG